MMKYLRFFTNYQIAGLLLLHLMVPAAAAQNILTGSLSSDEATEAAVEPTSLAEIERRREELASEQAALVIEIQQPEMSVPSLASKHLVRSQEKLEQIDRLLDAQASLAKALDSPAEPPSTELPEDEPSVLMLNMLYEQKVSADALLGDKRKTLQSAKEQLELLESRSKDARKKLEESSDEGRARNQRAARSAALAARIQAEEVNLITLELRTAQAEAERGNKLEERIAAVRDSMASNEAEEGGALSAVMERESALQREKSRIERQLATVELRLGAEKKRFAADPQSSGDALTVVEALTAYRDALGKQLSLANAELDRLVSLREIWSNWDSLLRLSFAPDDLPAWQELADSQLTDLRLAQT